MLKVAEDRFMGKKYPVFRVHVIQNNWLELMVSMQQSVLKNMEVLAKTSLPWKVWFGKSNLDTY